MKQDIHPPYYDKVTVTCSCGNSLETGSTSPQLEVEVCSSCHPYYTGKSKLIDVAGRVDKFKKKLASASKNKHPKKQAKKSNQPDNIIRLG